MAVDTLADNIQSFQNSFIPTIPEDTLNLLMAELQRLIDTGLADRSLTSGQHFPEFQLSNANGKKVTLAELLASGPLVVSFYRGAWCPYCNLEINALQKKLPEITAAGAQLVTISPQTPDRSADQVNQSNLTFEVLSDIGNRLSKQCGLVFTLPESLRPIYEAWQIDIPGHNADNTFELPMPATYIIDKEGLVRYAFVDMDYTKRLEPDLIIEQLRSL